MVTPELGKRYVRRNGTITAPLVKDPRPNRDFLLDEETGFVFDEKCGGSVFGPEEEHEHDLIEEYPDMGVEGVDFPSDNGNDNEPLE